MTAGFFASSAMGYLKKSCIPILVYDSWPMFFRVTSRNIGFAARSLTRLTTCQVLSTSRTSISAVSISRVEIMLLARSSKPEILIRGDVAKAQTPPNYEICVQTRIKEGRSDLDVEFTFKELYASNHSWFRWECASIPKRMHRFMRLPQGLAVAV